MIADNVADRSGEKGSMSFIRRAELDSKPGQVGTLKLPQQVSLSISGKAQAMSMPGCRMNTHHRFNAKAQGIHLLRVSIGESRKHVPGAMEFSLPLPSPVTEMSA